MNVVCEWESACLWIRQQAPLRSKHIKLKCTFAQFAFVLIQYTYSKVIVQP